MAELKRSAEEMNNLLSVILGRPCHVSKKIGAGVQLFRIRHPKLFFKEVAKLPGVRDECIAERRVWKVKDEDVYYAVLSYWLRVSPAREEGCAAEAARAGRIETEA